MYQKFFGSCVSAFNQKSRNSHFFPLFFHDTTWLFGRAVGFLAIVCYVRARGVHSHFIINASALLYVRTSGRWR